MPTKHANTYILSHQFKYFSTKINAEQQQKKMDNNRHVNALVKRH